MLSTLPRRAPTLAVLLVLAALTVSACGSKTVTDTGANGQVTTRTVPNVHFAKTKFLLHAGLAFGSFHRYVYKPYKAGAFQSGAKGKVKAIAKAAASAAFTYHELKQADDAAESSDTLRRRVHDPLAKAIATVKNLPGAIKSGGLGSIASANGLLNTFKTASSGAGADIQDR